MGIIGAMRRALTIALPSAMLLAASPVAAQGSTSKMPLTTQDPASAQPSLPKPMPNLSVPGSSDSKSQPFSLTQPSRRKTARRVGHSRVAHAGNISEPLHRPRLANVELVEPLPHPPQPPHVTVPVPAYPLENFITFFTTPPPPLVCEPTHADRFMPNPHFVDQQPTLCTADNP